MEHYDYAQRRMHRRLIVDLRGFQAPPLHEHIVDEKDSKLGNQVKKRDNPSYKVREANHKVDEMEPLIRAVNGARNIINAYGDEDRNKESNSECSQRRKVKDIDFWKILEKKRNRRCQWLLAGFHQLPAIAVVTSLWFMMALPFGVSFFPLDGHPTTMLHLKERG
jgi:hypothetical protein